MITKEPPQRHEDYMLWRMKQEDNMELKNYDRLAADGSYFERAIEVLEECANLMERKGQDYQGGSVQDDDYYPHGWRSFDTMLTTKVLRFRSVMEQQNDVNFDTAEDCLRDLINYAARCIVYLERNK